MKPAQFLKKLNDFQFWIKFVNFLYLLLVFTFVICEKEKYSYLEQQEYCRPLCGNKTISPEVRQKPSCLWCGKTFLSVVRQKLSCLWCGRSPLACGAAKTSCLWCGKAFLPMVRPAAKAFLPVVRLAARTSSRPSGPFRTYYVFFRL